MPIDGMGTDTNIELQPGQYFRLDSPGYSREVRNWIAPDGAELDYVLHTADVEKREVALLYLHGIESHGAWFDGVAERLCLNGYDVYCLDRRGSGLNRESRGFIAGHTHSYKTLIADIDGFVAALRPGYKSVIVIGLSWGAKLALAHAIQGDSKADGLVLVTPGIVPRVNLPLADKARIFLSAFRAPATRYPIPIEIDMFTDDAFFTERIRLDPLRLQKVTAKFYLESLRLDQVVRKGIGEVGEPVIVFYAGRDRIIDNEASQRIIEKCPAGVEVKTYAEQVHSIQFEAPHRLADDIEAWLKSRGLSE